MRDLNDLKVLPSTRIERLRLILVFWIFSCGFIYVAAGLLVRQWLQSGDLKEQSDSQSRRIILKPPARGRIHDRNGYVLVDNRVRWSVKADLSELQPEFQTEYRKLLAAERARETGQIDREKIQDSARINVLQRWLDKVWFVIDATSRNIKKNNLPVKSNPVDSPSERLVKIDDLRKHLRERRALPYTLVSDLAFPGADQSITTEEGVRAVARFVEQFPVDGPIRLDSDIIRTYPYGTLAAHVLGYVKDTDELPPNTLNDEKNELLQKLHYTGKKGAAGIEESYNEVLCGLSGWELWTKTSAGYNKELLRKSDPTQGSFVVLSLDIEIQRAAEKALAQIKDSQGKVLPAAAVMLDVNTGEILALASQPTFNPNRLADRVTRTYFDEIETSGGWLNRAIQGLYPPGSTFKVITAIAGMRNKVIDWDDILECGPSYRVGGRDFPEHDPAGYGQVDLEKMLAVSCNVWNYQVGLGVGIEPLAAEARRFGLDTPLLQMPPSADNKNTTELPFPANRGLVVPDTAYKLRIGAGPWTGGDTANTAIGQGFLLTTPLHMACVAASVARGETRTTPTIIHDPGRDARHQGAESIGLNGLQLAALRSGLNRCVEEGTARSVMIPGLAFAAKTGTSEYFQKGQKAHLAWIIGYASADNPAVAFCVLVEGQLDTSTWGGKTAGPVARDMILAWAKKTPVSEVKPEAEEPAR